MDSFIRTSFGSFLLFVIAGTLTKPATVSFMLLALGWSLAYNRHQVANYIWLSGACRYKHFSAFYRFLDLSLHPALDRIWRRVIDVALVWIPENEPVLVKIDATTRKKSGHKIEGASHYRNGAGSARQEWRTLWGLNFVLATLSVPLHRWSGHCLSVPIGLAFYLKKAEAKRLGLSYASRSKLARRMLDRVAEQAGGRQVCSIQDGDYATKAFLRDLPANVEVVGRLRITSKLYALGRSLGTSGGRRKEL